MTISDMPTHTNNEQDDCAGQIGKRQALVVGVNKALDDSDIEELRYAERDARAIAQALTAHCCFTIANHPLLGAEATSEKVRNALTDLMKNCKADDFAFFYFSGHTDVVSLGEGRYEIFLVTSNFNAKYAAVDDTLYLSLRMLRNKLYEAQGPGAVVIFLDCCYAGNIHRVKPDLTIDFRQLIRQYIDEMNRVDTQQPDRTRLIFAATPYGKTTKEAENEKHGLFTAHLLYAMNGDSRIHGFLNQKSGDLTLQRLHAYLSENMPDVTTSGEWGPLHTLAYHSNIAKQIQQREREMQQSFETQRQLTQQWLSDRPFDRTLCQNATFADFDTQLVQDFLARERVQRQDTFQLGVASEEQLKAFDLLQQGHPTYGALLCFGKAGYWVTGAETHCFVWSGNNSNSSILDARVLQGPLLKQYADGLMFLYKWLNAGRVLSASGSVEALEFPNRVLQEALANALVHRVYNGKSAGHVEIKIFGNRVEISNPGRLPNDLTLDFVLREAQKSLEGESSDLVSIPRNPDIATIFRLAGYMEEAGSGIGRMLDLMQKAGLQAPKFSEQIKAPQRFKVTLHRPKQVQTVVQDNVVLGIDATVQITRQLWSVPYHRNRFFTGYETCLEQLHTNFRQQTGIVQIMQALVGLGGIGKTEVAIEYAYRYAEEYQTVLWVKAHDHEQLMESFLALAETLALPEIDLQSQPSSIRAIKRWLQQHDRWLLIVDDVNDLKYLYTLLPTRSTGHVLLTSRLKLSDIVLGAIDLEQKGFSFSQEDAVLFLLRRSGTIDSDGTLAKASKEIIQTALVICEELGNLPLAVEQAGAYIEANSCSLAEYLRLYLKHGTKLLGLRTYQDAYANLVATTWSLSFRRIEQNDAVATELLRFFAFLAADAIPEELLVEGASVLGPVLAVLATEPLTLENALQTLFHYSLITRSAKDKTIGIHPLVQEVLRDEMSDEERLQWMERTVRAINLTFPEVPLLETAERCKRLFPHAQKITQSGPMSLTALQLLTKLGYYLREEGRLEEAEIVLKQAHRGTTSETPAIDQIHISRYLGQLYQSQGKLEQAQTSYEEALILWEQWHEQNSLEITTDMNNLALLYVEQGKYELAEQLLQNVLIIDQQLVGPDSRVVATDLNNLALLYHKQGRFEDAEKFYCRALTLDEKALSPIDHDIAIDLNNLAQLYLAQQRYGEAERYLLRVWSIMMDIRDPQHPEVIICLNNLAQLYWAWKSYNLAELHVKRILRIWELYPEAAYYNLATGAITSYIAYLQSVGRQQEAAELQARFSLQLQSMPQDDSRNNAE